MRLYTVKLRVWDTNTKISNIKEFRELTGAGLVESKEAIENAVGSFPSVDVIVSAERLGNYIAWRELGKDQIHLGLEILNEFQETKTPPIYT